MKYILFVGENAAGTDDIKNAPGNSKENQTMPSWQEPVWHSSPGKGGPSDFQKNLPILQLCEMSLNS